MVSTTDGSAVTAGTPTVYVTIDGGTQGTGAGTSTHEGNGQWSYAATQADTNGNHVAFTMSLSGAVSQCVNVYPVSFDPTDSVRIGITALPNAAADAAGGLPISDAGGLDLDAKVGALTFTVANKVDANVTHVSGDSTAADNLEAMYDGTGYVDDTAPASRSQVGAISVSSGGALSFAASGDNTGGAIKSVTFVGTQTGTYTNVAAIDGTFHQIDHATNAIDIVYSFAVGGGRSGASVQWNGYLTGSNDQLRVFAYNFVSTAWDQVGTIVGQNGSTVQSDIFDLLAAHTGTGADIGAVYVRIENTGQSAPVLYVDRLWVAAVAQGQTVGYANGAVWLDTNASNTNTESFVDGVADNPVSTIAAALTIAAAIGVKRIEVISGSSFTLASTQSNREFHGSNYAMALGGQAINNCHITGASLSGTCTGSGTIFEKCIIDSAVTIPPCTMRMCYFGDTTITAGSAGSFFLNSCASRVAGTGSANFDFGAALNASGLSMRDYSGGIEIENMGAGTGTYTMSLEGDGAITVNANCTGGTLALRGNFRITDNAAGAVSIVPTVPTINQVNQGVAQAGSANTITLAATASATNGQYDPGIITIVTGAGAGQSRLIIDYVGSTRVATVDKDWRTNPDATSSYVITATGGQNHVNEGLAAAGASGTITLNSSASAVDDTYKDQLVFLKSGTGQDQARIITAYNGTTKVATVHRNWDTTPDATSGYVILPTGFPVSSLQTGDSYARLGDIEGATFNTATDSLEAIRNQGDSAWITATGFSTHSAADVWSVATRVLTANTNLNDLDAAGIRSAVGLASADLDTQLAALPTAAEVATSVLTTQMTESYAADGVAPTLAQCQFLVMQRVTEFAISGTTITIKKLDGSTSAATLTLDDASNPTSSTRAT